MDAAAPVGCLPLVMTGEPVWVRPSVQRRAATAGNDCRQRQRVTIAGNDSGQRATIADSGQRIADSRSFTGRYQRTSVSHQRQQADISGGQRQPRVDQRQHRWTSARGSCHRQFALRRGTAGSRDMLEDAGCGHRSEARDASVHTTTPSGQSSQKQPCAHSVSHRRTSPVLIQSVENCPGGSGPIPRL